jgi:GNAT superfamily N-acetyltransferase
MYLSRNRLSTCSSPAEILYLLDKGQMAASYIIRSYQSTDLPECQALFRKAMLDSRMPLAYIKKCCQMDIADIAATYMDVEGGHWWVAVQENNIIGQVAVQPLRISDPKNTFHRPDDEIDHTCELRRLGIDPNAQRLGVGKRLIETLIEFARVHNFKKVYLRTGVWLDKACAFYERRGFRRAQVNQIPYLSLVNGAFDAVKSFESAAEMDEDDRSWKMEPSEKLEYFYTQDFELEL